MTSLLVGASEVNPRIAHAFQNRHSDAQGFARIKQGLLAELHTAMTRMPDPELTATTAAVAHAVRGATSSQRPADPPPSFSTMSDAELNRFTQQFGFLAVPE